MFMYLQKCTGQYEGLNSSRSLITCKTVKIMSLKYLGYTVSHLIITEIQMYNLTQINTSGDLTYYCLVFVTHTGKLTQGKLIPAICTIIGLPLVV